MSVTPNQSSDPPPTLEHLLDWFDEEEAADPDDPDEEEAPEEVPSALGSTAESSDPPEILDFEEKRVQEVMSASRDATTKYNYWLHQRRFIVWLFLKGKNNKEKRAKYHTLLNPNVIAALSSVAKKFLQKKGQGKASAQKNQKKRSELLTAAMDHAKQASEHYHPVMVEKLTANVFLEFLLSLNLDGEFYKSYGGFRSALT